MQSPHPRRVFLSAALSAAAAALLPRNAACARSQVGGVPRDRIRVRPFDLGAVRLLPGMVFDALQVNRRWILTLDPGRLLHMFRVTAGLPSDARPLGGWEAPDNELRGHFTGHYLSACALFAAQLGDTEIRDRGVAIAAALARCQAAIGSGYLSAFPEELFDRLRAGKRVWAPFYTLHKIMAGLLDTYTLSGDREALETLLGMARWTEHWVRPLDAAAMTRVLEVEYGGMNEVLYNLAQATADGRWLELAQRFDRHSLYAPLAAGRDELAGLHANTTIPQIIGAARGFELSGDPTLRAASRYFWYTVTAHRAYCTGGSSNDEHWHGPAGALAHELSGYTEESCVTYNLLKLTRLLFGWGADARLADYYERGFYNGILSTQHPRDGEKLYYLPLQSGYWKLFGTPLEDFWCCTGSMTESFAKLGDSIYFHDHSAVYVNLFVASTLDWRARGLRLRLETRFPEEDTLRLRVEAAPAEPVALRVRIPSWTEGASATLNGRPTAQAARPGSYLSIERRWSAGGELTMRLPMRLYVEPMPDDASLQAVMYGPLVLAGRLGSAGLDAATLRAGPTAARTVPEYKAAPVAAPPIAAPSLAPDSWLVPVSERALEFRTRGQPTPLTLEPIHRIFDERYAIYWKVNGTRT